MSFQRDVPATDGPQSGPYNTFSISISLSQSFTKPKRSLHIALNVTSIHNLDRRESPDLVDRRAYGDMTSPGDPSVITEFIGKNLQNVAGSVQNANDFDSVGDHA